MLVWTDNADVSSAIHYTFAVPEPSSLALGLTGALGLVWGHRRRTNRRSLK